MRNAIALVLLAWCALQPRAGRADKLHFERVDVSGYNYVKTYLTWVDADGRVVSGRPKEDFHFILDSADQGTATFATTFDALSPAQAVDVVIVAQVSRGMSDALDDLQRAIKQLAASFDAKSHTKIGLLAYSSEARRAAELSAPAELEAAVNTLALDADNTEVRMLDAVHLAIDVLNAAPKSDRKLIVLFSDGIDVNNMDRRAFQIMGSKALDAGIVIDTIGYAPFEPGRLRNLQELSRQSLGTDRLCQKSSEIGDRFGAVVDEIKKQYVVTFFSSLAGGDGQSHALQVSGDARARPVYSNPLAQKLPKGLPPESHWLRWLLIALAALGLLGLLAWLLGRERAEAPAVSPAPAPEVVAAAAPAPAPALAPQRTIALAAAGNGHLVIGWIVAVTGAQRDRTFKLAPARTVIGTADDCDVVIEDPFMSARHCEVRVDSGGGYTLVDLGSTNGIVVNDRHVRTHELIDNDQFRIGRTDFKFKTIG
jgi:hypothetical protein